jgi:dTDP-4-amino-4,6-dideoxygalactose transaminase
MNVPFHQYSFDETEEQAVLEVLRSGWLTLGKKTTEFEQAFLAYKAHKGFAIGVGTCSFGLQLILHALQKKLDWIPTETEIIVPVNTFFATASAVFHRGMKPVFCDIDPTNLLIDIADAPKRITSQTKALIVVHVAGNMPDMYKLVDLCNKYNIILIEDCAHAIESNYDGIPAGFWGIAGSFSFYPNKNITTGEGGMVTTQDEELAHYIRLLRNHGIDYNTYDRSLLHQSGGFRQYDIIDFGHKYAMTDLQASLGLAQLPKINDFFERRKEIITRYDEMLLLLDFIERPIILPACQSAHHLYIILLKIEKLKKNRDEVIQYLNDNQIQCSVHYKPLHLMSVFGKNSGQFPKAEQLYERTISLPLFPKITDKQIDWVINKFCQLNDII